MIIWTEESEGRICPPECPLCTHLAGEVSGELPDDVAGEDGDHALVPGHEQRGVQLGRAAQQGLVHKHWSTGGLLQGLYVFQRQGIGHLPSVIDMNQYAATTTPIWTYC